MLTCRECIERLRPDDPRIPTGRYHQSSCDFYCNKPTYYREVEQPKEPQEVFHRYIYEHEAKRDVRKQTTPTRQKGMTIE